MKSILHEIEETIFKHLQIVDYELIPCGNHDLKRNLVFRISSEHMHYIIKVFFDQNRFQREINMVPIVGQINPLKILYSGQLQSGYNWIIYNYIEGWLLDHVIEDLDLDQKRDLFYQIGMKMAEFHCLDTFKYFGDWTVEKQSPLANYRQFVIDDTERLIGNISCQDINQLEIITKSVEIVRNNYEHIRNLEIGRLCHRDLDGRNIIVQVNAQLNMDLIAFLDFEKCVIGNEYIDIINLYRKYFIDSPKLIPHFFRGYERVLPIDDSFNKELRFNLFRMGIDICSWSKSVSEAFYLETIEYLKKLMRFNEKLDELYAK